MNISVIIGNLCSIGAMLSDSFSSTRNTKKSILLVQCVSQIFYILSSFILKGYSATVQNVVAIFRNVFAAYEKKNKFLEIVLIATPVILGLYFNNRGLLGILPVIANLEYSVCMFVLKGNPIKLKYAFIVNLILFSIFNFSILNFVGGILDIISSITTATAIYKNSKEKE